MIGKSFRSLGPVGIPSCSFLLEAIPAAPIARLAFQERAHCAQIALMSQEIRLFLAFGPEFDGVRKRVHGLSMAADEGAAKVDVLQVVLLGL